MLVQYTAVSVPVAARLEQRAVLQPGILLHGVIVGWDIQLLRLARMAQQLNLPPEYTNGQQQLLLLAENCWQTNFQRLLLHV
jgi:hypothetical protein